MILIKCEICGYEEQRFFYWEKCPKCWGYILKKEVEKHKSERPEIKGVLL
jgi:hypothetical protein